MLYYPIYLDLKERPVLVVGGGLIAEGKAEQLISAGAQVTVVSPTLTERLGLLREQNAIIYNAREFEDIDLAGVALVISATDNQAVNQAVAAAARAYNILYNIVDQVPLCNFITPALVNRGDLQITVSTGGGSPSVAQLVKRQIEELIGDEYDELLKLATWLRIELKKQGASYQERRDLMSEFLSLELIELLRDGNRLEAERRAYQVLALQKSSKLDELS
jgi:precorrin-2 dehydrogenase / sirohydrochlorin ferrochelatase